MGRPNTRWLARITAYIAAIVIGLSVVLAAAFAPDALDPEPSALIVLGVAAVVAAYLGRVTYRGVSDLLDEYMASLDT